MKKEIRKALAKAKELEKIPYPSKEEIVKVYKDGLEEAERLRKLLKPAWFILDEKEARLLSGKKDKKPSSPSRKKKSL
ncbi:MAG TPA: hypothetical protein VI612_00625 [Candidatus Nanoarchaeia archaeon]|nr:hypothetical protein [Candidatus Nanoarchaeia archaeon]